MMKINATNSRKPMCKVCKDAGKPESVWSSHYVKSRDGTVTCPTLNSSECRYCHKLGHTVSKCPTIKKNEKIKNFTEKMALEQQKMPQKQEKTNKNLFSVLNDDDSDNEEETIEKTEFPQLCAPIKNTNTNVLNYKNILLSEAPKQKPVPQQFKIIQRTSNNNVVLVDLKSEIQETKPEPINNRRVVTSFKMRSWADDYSSDEDEQDEEEQSPKEVNKAFVYNDAW
jgi:hypothetical protein